MAKTTQAKPIKVDRFARVSSVALRDRRLSTRDKMVYVALCDHADITGRCWPSVDRLRDLSGLGKTAVHAGLDQLEALGYIERIKRSATSNLYRVYPIPMNDVMEFDSSLDERGTPPGEHAVSPQGEYFVFDKRSGVLRYAGTGSPLDEHEEYQRIEEIKKEWNENLQNPLGTEKKEANLAFRYYIRKEFIRLETIKDIIAMVKESDFLQGRNERHWKPSLFWCVKNRERILTGRYSNYTNKAGETYVDI